MTDKRIVITVVLDCDVCEAYEQHGIPPASWDRGQIDTPQGVCDVISCPKCCHTIRQGPPRPVKKVKKRG